MNNDLIGKIVGWAVIAGLLLLCGLWLAGCKDSNTRDYSDPNIAVQDLTLSQRDNVIAYKNAQIELANKEKALADLRAFRIQMLWAVLGAGAIAIFWKPAIGIPLALLFSFMISYAEALTKYNIEIGWVSMGLGALMVGYVIWLNHDKLFVTAKALKEVVTGNEDAKKTTVITGIVPTFVEDVIRETQKAVQSPATTKLVSAIRAELPSTK